MKKMFYVVLCSIVPCTGYASGSSFTGTIKAVVCHANEISPVCHVEVNGAPASASCVTSGWQYSFNGTNSEGKNFLSILLAAQMSKQTVTIGGQGTCSIAGGSEDMRHIYISTP